MDAKEFILKAIRLCENHDCHECPLDGGEEDKCLLDHFNIRLNEILEREKRGE